MNFRLVAGPPGRGKTEKHTPVSCRFCNHFFPNYLDLAAHLQACHQEEIKSSRYRECPGSSCSFIENSGTGKGKTEKDRNRRYPVPSCSFIENAGTNAGGTGKGKTERHTLVSCRYCYKVVCNHLDLEAHLQPFHQEEIKSFSSWKYPGPSSSHIRNAGTNADILPNSVSINPTEAPVNNMKGLFETTSPLDLSKGYFPHESGFASSFTVPQTNLDNINCQYTMSSCSLFHGSCVCSSVFAQSNRSTGAIPLACARPGITPTVALTGPSLSLCSKDVCNFNTYEQHTRMNEAPKWSNNSFQEVRSHTFHKHVHHDFELFKSDSARGSDQSSWSKECITSCSTFLRLSQSSIADICGQIKKESGKTCEVSKCSSSALLEGKYYLKNVTKRPKVVSTDQAVSMGNFKKELLPLLNDPVSLSPGLGIPCNNKREGKGEGEDDLDLSLHL